MPKYGRGLNREIVAAVNKGLLNEPFDVAAVRQFVANKKWKIAESYLSVSLANGAAETHSLTYKKYFISLGNGKYRLKNEFRGSSWL